MMKKADIEERRAKATRSTIFKDGKLVNPDNLKEVDWRKTKICGVHFLLANKLNELLPDDEEKKEILKMIDTSYNMAKRMATKLDEYRFGVPHPNTIKEGDND